MAKKTPTNVKDLTKEPPRSPHARLGGFVILPRTIDKCRALLAGKNGEYKFNCGLDRMFFDFKGIDAEAFRKLAASGASDEEITDWVEENGEPKSEADIKFWSEESERENYKNSDDPEDKEWLEKQNARLGLPKDGTLFDYLDADDEASFKK